MSALIFFGVIALLVFFVIGIYNGLVTSRNGYKNAFSQIDVQLERRYDLIPNLVETAKGYIKHERETLEAVIAARGGALGALKAAQANPGDPTVMKNLSGAEGNLTGALGRLQVTMEAYPDLKANQNMMQLSEELSSTENRISFARQAYNDSVMAYNNKREVFPNSFISGMFNFAAAQSLELESPEARKAVKVAVLGCACFETPYRRSERQARACERSSLADVSMNFFEHQAAARAQSRWMLWAFAVSVLLTVAGVVAIMAATLALGGSKRLGFVDATLPHLPALTAVGLGVAAVIGLSSLYKIARLRAGGGAVAVSLGGVLVPPETREPRLRRLRNVVEEIAIASGVPVPQIYVLEQEAGINAFAAGYAPADAAVTVTRGALEKLTRDELQGVVAHEFSHLLNGDMRLNIRLMGLAFGLLVITIIGREIIANTPRGGKRGPTIAVLGFGLMVVGGIGLFSARLIKARISRQREYLADASAVQFTRQTLGLAGALKKIAGIDAGSTLKAQNGEEVSHMLFGDGLGHAFLFATHPPLVDRIQRIEPGFEPQQLAADAAVWNAPDFYTDAGDEGPVKFLTAATRGVTPAAVVAQVGNPGTDDYRYAETLHATIPLILRNAAQSDADAPALLLALLMDGNETTAAIQRAAIADTRGAGELARVLDLMKATENLHAALRLPLAAIAFPTLRQRPAAELLALKALVGTLSRADGRIGAFEFVLARMLSVQLGDWLAPASASRTGKRRLVELEEEAALLLSVVADAGAARGDEARRAFVAGWAHLWPQASRAPSFTADWTTALDTALDQLDGLLPMAKQMLIEALVKVLANDGRVTVGEAELLRVTAASLHCPLPPALAGAC